MQNYSLVDISKSSGLEVGTGCGLIIPCFQYDTGTRVAKLGDRLVIPSALVKVFWLEIPSKYQNETYYLYRYQDSLSGTNATNISTFGSHVRGGPVEHVSTPSTPSTPSNTPNSLF